MILSKIQTSFGKASEKVSKVFNRLSLSGGWAKLGLLQNLGCGSAGAVLQMCGWLKLFFKMCGGKNFKNIRVGLRVGLSYRVSLLKNAFKSVRLNCQVAKSPFFSRHFRVALSFYAWA